MFSVIAKHFFTALLVSVKVVCCHGTDFVAVVVLGQILAFCCCLFIFW